MRAVCMLRDSLHYRKDAFLEGLKTCGYKIHRALDNPHPGDLLVIWNRYGAYHSEATRYERAGATVLVAENGYLGKSWRPGTWYSLALGHHAGAGKWPDGGPDRWDRWDVDLEAPRSLPDGEIVILDQRGIGEPGIASPRDWAQAVQRKIGGRIRPHPDTRRHPKTLRDDLANAKCVVTWASSAGLSALMLGVPVVYAYPKWIGARAAVPIDTYKTRASGPLMYQGDTVWGERLTNVLWCLDRLIMLRRLAWAMWELDEIRNGSAINRLVCGAK